MKLVTAPLTGRRVLVTAGPTWVRIDAVRHIGNVSSGRTGLAIARALARAGAEVTLLWGPGRTPLTAKDRRQMGVEDFVTFDDLHGLVRRHIGSCRYDAMIHAAAVSDYRLAEGTGGKEGEKVASNRQEWVLRLVPTPKIVDEVKALDPHVLLVKFKLVSGRTREELLRIAAASREASQADLILGNDLQQIDAERHPAVLLDKAGLVAEYATQRQIAAGLTRRLAEQLRGKPTRPTQ